MELTQNTNLGLLSLGKRWHQGDLRAANQYLKGAIVTEFLAGPVAIGQRIMVLNYKRVDSNYI